MATPSDRLVAKLIRCQRRRDAAAAALGKVENERNQLIVEARKVTPPVTIAKLAELLGVTEAAVTQRLHRLNGTGPYAAKAS